MLKLIKNLTKRDYIFVIISFALIVFQVYLELKMPDFMSKVTVLTQSDDSLMSEILLNGLYMMLCAFGSLISTIIVGYLTANIAASFSLVTRKKIFEKVENLSLGEVKQFEVSSLITRTTNDITQIEMLIAMGLQLLIKAPITAIWAVTKILNKNFTWSMATLGAVVLLLVVIIILTIIVVPKFKIVQKLTDKLNNVTRENLKGIRVVRAFNAESYEQEKFDNVNSKLTNQQLFNQRVFSIMQPVMYLTMHTLMLSIYFIGAFIIRNSILSDKVIIFSDMVVFSSYAIQVIISFLMLALIFMLLPRAGVSAKRINEVLDSEISVKDGTIDKSENKGTIEFRNVSFKYPDAEEYILEDISFKVNKGEIIAFIGSTGSGKSTLINLIPRFYDVTDGEILIDDINVKDYKLNHLYNKIGYVSQKAVVFDASVKDNVFYGDNGKKKNEELLKKAIEVAQAEDFVSKLDNKYNSHVAQGGTNISGGQKQRLSIARAIARDPEIYIFDDSFSALDYKTDANLRKALKEYTKDATILIVAQRIGTIMNADKIVVLDEGKIVGIGKHKDLLKSCDIYKQIALSQITKEELDNA